MDKYEKVKFGSYKNSPILWRILKKDTDSLFLLSEYALDNICFNEKFREITWEHSGIRRWMNSEFIMEAFSEYEKNRILPVVHGQNKFVDLVFCLSIGECLKYLPDEEDRVCYTSEYVQSKKNVIWDNPDGRCLWWLRSMAYNRLNAIYVERDGVLNPYSPECVGTDIDDDRMLVRPAIKIKIDK